MIIKKTDKDFFVPLENNECFSIGLPDKKEPCPYLLKDGQCLLHDLGCKPADCRVWPIGLTSEGEFIVGIECPAIEFLSKKDYSEAGKILEEIFNAPALKEAYYKSFER